MKKIVAILLLAAVTLAIYAPALNDQFVWDDTALVLRDPLIRSWRLIPEGFNHFLFVDATPSDFYRPLQRLVYTAVYCAFAFNPSVYHAISIICHTLAAIALFLMADEFLLSFGLELRPRRVVAFAASLLWAIHPVHTAAVVYVSGLADPLAAMFGFAACYCFLRGSRAQHAPALLWFVIGGLALLGSVLSKEIGSVFIPIALLFFGVNKNWRSFLKTIAAALLVLAIYFSLRHGAEHYPTPPPRVVQSWTVRPITMARAVAEYTGLILLPVHLHMDREIDVFVSGPNDRALDAAAWRELQTITGILILALLVWWWVRSRNRDGAVCILLLLAAISYGPVSGIWQLNAALAEHWIYIPTAFVFLVVVLELFNLIRRRTAPKAVRLAVGGLIACWCLFLATRTFIRTFDWKDQRTFLQSNIASGGPSARMLINLGGLELSQGHLDLAKQDLQAALKKEPNQPLAIINLAAVALKENDWKTARELLTRATEMPLVEARAQELMVVLESKEHGKADLMRLRLASRTGAPDWSIESRYIRLLDEAGATGKAIDETRHCLATEWYRAETWQLLSQLLKKTGDTAHAADALAMARTYDVHLAFPGGSP